MQKSTMESASWQRPLYGFKISQNQAGIPLKSGVLGRPGEGEFNLGTSQETLYNKVAIQIWVIRNAQVKKMDTFGKLG